MVAFASGFHFLLVRKYPTSNKLLVGIFLLKMDTPLDNIACRIKISRCKMIVFYRSRLEHSLLLPNFTLHSSVKSRIRIEISNCYTVHPIFVYILQHFAWYHYVVRIQWHETSKHDHWIDLSRLVVQTGFTSDVYLSAKLPNDFESQGQGNSHWVSNT